ncbi:MAG: TonB family protein [Campylobacterota bacterium]|nr:TonB family protein [Campylobacterota bacterium]
MSRYFSSFLATTFIYTALAVTFLYSYSAPKLVSEQQQNSKETVKFTVIAQKSEPPVKKPEKKIEKKVEKPQEKIVKKTEPVKKIEKPKKKIVTKTKPVKKEPKKIVKKATPKPLIQKTQIKQNKTVSKSKSTLTDPNDLKIKKNKYYTTIKETISKNKRYPKIAVRRGIQGDVKVKFTISPNGELVSFNIIDGKKVFKKSIQKAITQSFPIKPPQGILTANLDLSLTIEYKLY